ncbi:hypothetical protein PsYK624_049630 [Phanerochaete sordida]|uniref:Uncharacterized protein n=1 Tax=Phanerochaete sordida TaxID=48140 RepID=A0A9P3G612_9APHY|nr:hypothetical protein PsYK624_049630 [Phanerochaete sordida]
MRDAAQGAVTRRAHAPPTKSAPCPPDRSSLFASADPAQLGPSAFRPLLCAPRTTRRPARRPVPGPSADDGPRPPRCVLSARAVHPRFTPWRVRPADAPAACSRSPNRARGHLRDRAARWIAGARRFSSALRPWCAIDYRRPSHAPQPLHPLERSNLFVRERNLRTADAPLTQQSEPPYVRRAHTGALAALGRAPRPHACDLRRRTATQHVSGARARESLGIAGREADPGASAADARAVATPAGRAL